MLSSPPLPSDLASVSLTSLGPGKEFAVLLPNEPYYPKPQGEELRALVMALVYGCVHMIGPDHLGTLVTLSTVAQPMKAFRIGAAWGLGHTFGMAFVGLIFLLLHHAVHFDSASWEYYGQYFIGFSMVSCGVYFIYNEACFIREEADGTIVAMGCVCHPLPALQTESSASVVVSFAPKKKKSSTASKFGIPSALQKEEGTQSCRPCRVQEPAAGTAAGTAVAQALAGPGREDTLAQQPEVWLGRDAKGAIVGMVQGLCCPMGVVGITFMANLHPPGILIFLLIFMLLSSLGTACLAVAWALVTARGLGGFLSPQTAYRVSCGFTITLGLLWIFANAFGFIAQLDFAESLTKWS